MSSSVRPDVRALASASRDLLNRGDVIGAERVLTPVFNELWGDASVWHLMGLIKQSQNKLDEAERYLRRAVAETLTQPGYYNDLGVTLQARGELPEAMKVFRAAIALSPTTPVFRVNLVHCLSAAGDLAEAEREAHAYIAALPTPEAWTLLGLVQRTEGRFEEALASAEEALRMAPKLRGLKHNRAIALDRLGRTKEALDIFEVLAREDLETPDLALNFARALYHVGRAEEAEDVLERATTHWPQAVAAQLALARMRFARGLGEESTAPLEATIRERPQDLQLRLVCADFLNRNSMGERAKRVLEDALRVSPDAPGFLTALGITLDGLGRSEEALGVLRRAAQLAGDTPQTQRNLIAPLLRSGKAHEALLLIRSLRRTALRDQSLLACEVTALRLLNDPGYTELCNYERHVKSYNIATPAGYFNLEKFNALLAESLRAYLKGSNPLDRTIPNGAQTPRDLRQLSDPIFRDFFAAIDAPVRRYLSGLNADDPVGRRRGNGYRIKSAWGTSITQAGFITSHVHEAGWIHALYVVEAPPARERSGWTKFGEAGWKIEGAGPEHWVEPKPGALTIFPSYYWHGVGAVREGERLTIGVEIAPA